ncbi:hypothetical protein [Nostoc sp. 106C]|nr:hypothetical protein [Nostoc sp. 106C]
MIRSCFHKVITFKTQLHPKLVTSHSGNRKDRITPKSALRSPRSGKV